MIKQKDDEKIKTIVNISGDCLSVLLAIYLQTIADWNPENAMTLSVFVNNFFKYILAPITQDVKQRNLSAIQNSRIDYFEENLKNKVEQKLNSLAENNKTKNITFEKEKLKWLIENTEAALLTIQNEYESKKMPLLVNCYANLLFENIDHLIANNIIKLTQDLTYQQILIIACIGQHSKSNPLTTNYLMKDLKDDLKAYSITSDLMCLYHKGIVFTNGMLIDINNFVPSALSLKGCGEKIYDYLELDLLLLDKEYKEIEKIFL